MGKNIFWYITQKRYERAVLEYPWFLPFVPDKYKTQELCKTAVEKDSYCMLKFVPDHLKTQEMWDNLEFAPDKYKTQEMCEKAVEKDLHTLEFVPDWFVMQELIKLWHDDNNYDDGMITEWYEG